LSSEKKQKHRASNINIELSVVLFDIFTRKNCLKKKRFSFSEAFNSNYLNCIFFAISQFAKYYQFNEFIAQSFGTKATSFNRLVFS